MFCYFSVHHGRLRGQTYPINKFSDWLSERCTREEPKCTFHDLDEFRLKNHLALSLQLRTGTHTHAKFAFSLSSAVRAHSNMKSLTGSTVKIAGRDVLMSYKIIYSILLVPVLW